MRFVILEHHPNDSSVRICDDGICQSLTQRMGTGGGNVPIIIQIDDSDNEKIFKHSCD